MCGTLADDVAASRLHARFPGLTLGRLRLGSATPVAPVPGLPGLWVKDEGRYGDGPTRGNKVRKLEWLLPHARLRGHRTLLTFGALGTNHGLATALYGREHGFRVALALVDQPRDEHVEAQLERLRASGATLHFTGTPWRTVASIPGLVARHRRPYVIPTGGSSAMGALGYVEMGLELGEQVRAGLMPEPRHVVLPLSTAGTAAGLLLGLRLAGLDSEVLGVAVADQLNTTPERVERLARLACLLLQNQGATGLERPDLRTGLRTTEAQLGDGYGLPTRASVLARSSAAELGLPIPDPVYGAKALAAVLAGREDGSLRGPVLYLSTYGGAA